MNLKQMSVAGFLIAVLALMILILRKSIIAEGLFAILIQILAVTLMIWARVKFGFRSFHAAANPTDGGLITTGPYRYLRHPIYAALIYFLWAGIFSHISFFNILLGLIATAGLLIRIFAEERLVTEKYPEYSGYALRTKRIIPFIF